MRFGQLINLTDASPVVRLLNSHHAAFLLPFIDMAFKTSDATSSGAGHDDMRRRLASYQDDLREDGYDSNQPHYQLTRHCEDTLRFVDSLLRRQSRFVGTESRLPLVIDTLGDIVRGASDNPDRRIEELQLQRQAIDLEIAGIESGGHVEVYQEAMIRDRFPTAVDLLKTLQGDFRAVEDRFEQIVRDVYLQTQTRGRILGHALDAEDVINQEDEGVSFYAFVAFLFSPASQARLRSVIAELVELPALRGDREGVGRIRQMLPTLLSEADNVLRQTGRLSETLRRLLDAESIDHRRRVAKFSVTFALRRLFPDSGRSIRTEQ